ncbi:excinuclease ABC subunit C [Erysipelothrix larvae]|uniref:UvrABC system protein C n=1 Tax=Erysipelothrix larvae TaxID=1514105 RepID=A0A0X8H0J4_9FIRM|nr:excinuclease ABC subunit UvrC [Erysipelothrix larvae]AMC93865.1 excinuclease ABC subunit C [Erysipelothrix larvae]
MKLTLKEKLSVLPPEPGCYQMKDKHGTIIYVGKAKNLKNRVSSYFTGAHDHKTTRLVSEIEDFDILVTKTEKESLILEINLIKEHRPKFNIIFIDDKSYPYLKLNRTGIPVVSVSRDRKQNPKFMYFGPYPNATAARKMSELLSETLPSDAGFVPNKQKIYTTLNHTEAVWSEAEIDAWRQNLVKVLQGNDKGFRDALVEKMMHASETLNFEVASHYKEKLEALDYISDRQQVQFSIRESFDMFSYAVHRGYLAIVGLFVRSGRLLEKTMALEATLEDPEDALLSFISQFYERQPKPKHVYVPNIVDAQSLEELLGIKVSHPQRGNKRQLLDIGKRNAEIQLESQFEVLQSRQEHLESALVELQHTLNLNQPIRRVEIFDNSHISGSFAVSACVVYDDGEPNRKLYRRYKLSTGSDDLASMREVIYRRYFRILKEQTQFPDLIIVDGGFNQVKSAQEVLDDLGLTIPLCGLVKDDRHRTRGIMDCDGQEKSVSLSSALFNLLTQMQDEVHRYVITYHRLLRKKKMTASILDEVEGLGSVGKKQLYAKFGSLKNMRQASIEELSAVVSTSVAQNIYELLHLEME